MNSQEYRNLQEAYLDVYQEEVLDEVRGGGKIDAVSDIPSIGERGSRSAKDAGMLMSPLDRATARANALKTRGTPEATKRANRINSRFVNPTKSAISRSILAAANARRAEKTRLMNPQESYDLFDYIMEYLIIEGYADTNENALVIMANMSEDWRESIVEGAVDEIGGYRHSVRKFDEEFKDLTPEKEERVKERVNQLAGDILGQSQQMKALNNKPFGRYRPEVNNKKRAILVSAKKKQKLVQNASDALIRTSISRSASIQKRIQDLMGR